MTIPTLDQYARILAELEGDNFQQEICARLSTVDVSFQPIPAEPQGDGGLDGCSHDGTRGYCCYGQEHKAKNNRGRESAIIQKFSDDLLRLLELQTKGARLLQVENTNLRSILAGRKLVHITLISNWFDSNRVIGPLNERFAKYKVASRCECVDRNATLTILGPRDLANQHAVDQLAIERALSRMIVTRVHATAATITIEDPKDFDSKLHLLREIRPDRIDAIDRLAKTWRTDWRTALAFERELDETLPDLHRSFEQARAQIVAKVSMLMLSAAEPHAKLEQVVQIAEDILKRTFASQYNELLPELSSGLIARMIGECPFGWDKPPAPNAKQ